MLNKGLEAPILPGFGDQAVVPSLATFGELNEVERLSHENPCDEYVVTRIQSSSNSIRIQFFFYLQLKLPEFCFSDPPVFAEEHLKSKLSTPRRSSASGVYNYAVPMCEDLSSWKIWHSKARQLPQFLPLNGWSYAICEASVEASEDQMVVLRLEWRECCLDKSKNFCSEIHFHSSRLAKSSSSTM